MDPEKRKLLEASKSKTLKRIQHCRCVIGAIEYRILDYSTVKISDSVLKSAGFNQASVDQYKEYRKGQLRNQNDKIELLASQLGRYSIGLSSLYGSNRMRDTPGGINIVQGANIDTMPVEKRTQILNSIEKGRKM